MHIPVIMSYNKHSALTCLRRFIVNDQRKDYKPFEDWNTYNDNHPIVQENPISNVRVLFLKTVNCNFMFDQLHLQIS